MADEFVDIVDESLRVSGTILKSEAHKLGLLHKCIIAELFNSRGEMLLIKPASHKQDYQQWVSPVGGHVVASESDEDALRREMLEEIGIERYELRRKGAFIYDRQVLGRHENHYFIVFEVTSDDPPTIGEEVADFKYFTVEEIRHAFLHDRTSLGAPFLAVLEQLYPELCI
jgi:isopentenyl-diphosphate Delta-isomerase